MRTLAILLLTLLLPGLAGAAPASDTGIPWRRDDAAAFAEARKGQRFVLLYLEAVWCHWCHVMDHDTYADPAIVDAVEAHYVPLRIDQDARPDLANRYRDYGWPATIVFAADGTEIVKRRGYIPPERMARLLAAIVSDPSPEHVAAAAATVALAPVSALPDALRAELARRHADTFDPKHGGLRTGQKYLDRDSAEYALTLALDGDAVERERIGRTLAGASALLDPVWGGVYQYSTGGDWAHPHFEKLTMLQGEYLRVYALGYAVTGDARWLAVAQRIRDYAAAFLAAPDGGYYASQDADLRPGEHSAEYFALDDTQRRKLGVPRVDTHRYARETGALVEALAYLDEVSDDAGALAAAEKSARWALAQRALPGGGFRHDGTDAAGPYLGDTLAMGRAFLQLYRSTGEREWLAHAAAAGDFIAARFRAPAGYASAVRGDAPIAPVPHLDENIALARFANLLARYSGSETHRAMARHALTYLAQRDVALERLTEAGILLADREFNRDPIHLTVIGPRGDAATQSLYTACLRVAAGYKRLDWWDRSQGPLMNADVNYPPLKRPAAFVCTEQRCSTPIVRAEDVAIFLAESAEQ
jgi:uncharacterized protein YyaL (SSP411 family)